MKQQDVETKRLILFIWFLLQTVIRSKNYEFEVKYRLEWDIIRIFKVRTLFQEWYFYI